jgi:hypothetical protein
MYPLDGIGLEVPFFLQVRSTSIGCGAAGRVLIAETPAEEADVAAVIAAPMRACVSSPADVPAPRLAGAR